MAKGVKRKMCAKRNEVVTLVEKHVHDWCVLHLYAIEQLQGGRHRNPSYSTKHGARHSARRSNRQLLCARRGIGELRLCEGQQRILQCVQHVPRAVPTNYTVRAPHKERHAHRCQAQRFCAQHPILLLLFPLLLLHLSIKTTNSQHLFYA